MDNDEIAPLGLNEGANADEEQVDDFRAIYYRMEVSRRVEDFRRAIHAGRYPIISEISQLILYKNYFNELTGANQTSLTLLQNQNKLSEFRLPKNTPLSPARRTAEMAVQQAVIQEHEAKRTKTTELCHTLNLKLDELVASRTSLDLLPACRLVLDQFNESFKTQLDTCQIISAEVRAIKNLVCTELDAESETLDDFNQKFNLLKTERNLKEPPKVKALSMSANLKRVLGFLANNAKSYQISNCPKSPKFYNSNYFHNFFPSRHCSTSPSKPPTEQPPSTQSSSSTTKPKPAQSATSTAPTATPSTAKTAPEPRPTTQLPSPTTSTTTAFRESAPGTPPSRSNIQTSMTALDDSKFVFLDNIFLSETLLNSPYLEGIKQYFSNIKCCYGDTLDFESQSRTRIADLSYLQRTLILSCRTNSNSSESITEIPLIQSKKVNYLPRPPSNHCLTMALNFIELLKTNALKRPTESVIPNSLPLGYICINSDKTSNCCILPKSTYMSLMNEFILSNSDIFEHIKISSAYTDIDRVEKVLSHIKKLASQWQLLTAERDAILFKNVTLPKLRGLCKTHKKHTNHWHSLKFRPIIGSSSSVLSNLATLLDKVLQPLAASVPFRIRDSFYALDFFQSIDLNKYFIVPFDATSLYTNISLELAQDAVYFWFQKPEFSDLIPTRFHNLLFIFEALEILFSHNYFTFNGDIYLQKDGLSMGCNAAVSIAELSLGFLESKNNFDPKLHKRYIDDAVDIVLKTEAHTEVPRLLEKYNSLDDNISWTCDFDLNDPKTIFLDMVIDYSTPGNNINQYHKPHKKINSFVPFDSKHPRHTLHNLPRSLFDRAFTLNTIEHNKELAFKQIEQGLTILNYPYKIISNCKAQAKKIVPSKYVPKAGNLQKKVIYLCLTNNSTNTVNRLHVDITTLNRILHMDDTGMLNNIHIKISKRQPPSVGTLNNMLSGAHTDQNPARCGRKICDTCPVICLLKSVDLLDFEGRLHSIRAARFTCKSSNLIYFIFDPVTFKPLYIGHTGRKLLTRMYEHRGGKKKNSGKSKIRFGFLKNSSPNKINFQITAITASPYRVKRLETERFYINLFRPAWNTQLQHFWWQDASFEYTDKE